MAEHERTSSTRRLSLSDVWKLALAIVGVVAVVQELRTPPEERTWHGTVGGVVPYDFRPPSVERARQTFWNPEGPLVSSRVWGVGWSPNVGAILARIRR